MLWLSPIVAFSITLLVIISTRPLSIKLGLVDSPGGRKMHFGQVPIIGGIGIFCGLAFSLLTVSTSLMPYRSLIAAMGLLLFIGILDDFRELSARAKLAGQIVAALIISVWGHLALHSLGDLFAMGGLELGWFAIPMTIIAIVGLINAINLIDGVDGLAGSLLFVQISTLLVSCLYLHHYLEAQLLAIILACLLGFLFFNFPFGNYKTRRVFMGDAGSMLLGLLLGWFTIKLTQGSAAIFNPITMVWIVAFPLMDTVASIVRRVLKGKSPLRPDKLHFHHLLLRSGYSPRAITLIISVFSIIMAASGVVLDWLGTPEWLMLALFLIIFATYLYMIRHAWLLMKLLKRKPKLSLLIKSSAR